MSIEIGEVMNELREYMFANIYSLKSEAKREELKAEEVVCRLFNYYINNPDKLPNDYLRLKDIYSREQLVCDYIAGMTDRYAIDKYIKLFIPTQWGK